MKKNTNNQDNILAGFSIAIAALAFVGSFFMPQVRLFLAAPSQPPPVEVKLPSETLISGAATKPWCLDMREQWKFRMEEWGEDNQTIMAVMEEYNCGYWSIALP